MLSSWLCVRGWSLLLNLVILCLRQSQIRLWLFLAFIPKVLFTGTILNTTLGVLFHILLPILVKHVFRESTFTADFLANWACSN